MLEPAEGSIPNGGVSPSLPITEVIPVSPPRFLARAAALAAVISLGAAGAASASPANRVTRIQRRRGPSTPRPTRTSYVKFNARNPERIRDIRAITGMPRA